MTDTSPMPSPQPVSATGAPSMTNGTTAEIPGADSPVLRPVQGFPLSNQVTAGVGVGTGGFGTTGAGTSHGAAGAGGVMKLYHQIQRYRSIILDRLAPQTLHRWLAFGVLLCLFLLRMFLLEGFYLWAYILFIFLLNQFILFLQPKDRASLVAAAVSREQGEDDSGPELPTADSDEFRPFVRRLPEFRFWHSSSLAVFLCFWITFFPWLDVPVYWPVLVLYFFFLAIATFRRQWLDMKRLKYVPWDLGKKKYTSDPKKFVVKRNNIATAAQAFVQKQTAALAGTSRAQTAKPVPTMSLPRKPIPKKSVQD